MHDQMELDRPLDRAVHSIEYVIRHQGASHLRPAACRLSLPERESMDVTFLFTAFLLILIYISCKLTRLIYIKIFRPIRIDAKMKTQ